MLFSFCCRAFFFCWCCWSQNDLRLFIYWIMLNGVVVHVGRESSRFYIINHVVAIRKRNQRPVITHLRKLNIKLCWQTQTQNNVHLESTIASCWLIGWLVGLVSENFHRSIFFHSHFLVLFRPIIQSTMMMMMMITAILLFFFVGKPRKLNAL